MNREFSVVQDGLRKLHQFVDVNREAAGSKEDFQDLMKSAEYAIEANRVLAQKILILEKALAQTLVVAEEEYKVCKDRWNGYREGNGSDLSTAYAHSEMKGAEWTTKKVKKVVEEATAKLASLDGSQPSG